MAFTAMPSPLSVTFLLFLLLLGASFYTIEAREPFACDPKDAKTKGLPFCLASLKVEDRVKDLIGRLTLQEKVKLLVSGAAAVPRLGIKGYEWWSEALHGVSNVGPGTKFGGDFPGATSFPQVITTAASFNASLWESIGRVRILPFQKKKKNWPIANFLTIIFFLHEGESYPVQVFCRLRGIW